MELFIAWLNRCGDCWERMAGWGVASAYLAAFGAVLAWLIFRG